MPTPINELDLSVRAYTRLRDAGVVHLEDLQAWNHKQLQALAGFGSGSLAEVTAALGERGLRLSPVPNNPRGSRGKYNTLHGKHQEIVEKYCDGKRSLREIAAEYGVKHASVRRVLLKRDVRLRTRYEWHKIRSERREALAPTDFSPAAIALIIQQQYRTMGPACEYLELSRFTLLEYLRADKFPGAFQIAGPGSEWLIPVAALEAYKTRPKQPRPGKR